jgi:hypothetical protein
VVDKAGLVHHYARADLGFVLRSESIVNRVACPTKLIEYMRFGIVPIVISPKIGDFEDYGYQFVTLEEFEQGIIPSRSQLAEMAQANFAVLHRLQDEFRSGAEVLRRLRLANLAPNGSLRGYPAGLEGGNYPARRELYLFGETPRYFADWIVEPYTEWTFHGDAESTGTIIRIVPALSDFRVRGIALDISARSYELAPRVEVVQSRGQRIGEFDYFRAEAPYIEVKLSASVALFAVKVTLDDPEFGPMIWRKAALGGGDNPSLRRESSVRLRMMVNGAEQLVVSPLVYV